MAELILEPYAGYCHWEAPSGQSLPWEKVLGEFLERLSARCEIEGQTLIGHIKGLATFPEGAYLRANTVGAGQPADIDGHAPDGCRELTFTLNALVYGLPYERLSAAVDAAAAQVSARWGATVAIQPVHEAGAEPHHHH